MAVLNSHWAAVITTSAWVDAVKTGNPLSGDDLITVAVTGGPTRIEYLAWSDFNPSRAARAFLEMAAPG